MVWRFTNHWWFLFGSSKNGGLFFNTGSRARASWGKKNMGGSDLAAITCTHKKSRLQICPYNFGNKATDGTYRSKYWFPGFGFDSGPNLQPWKWLINDYRESLLRIFAIPAQIFGITKFHVGLAQQFGNLWYVLSLLGPVRWKHRVFHRPESWIPRGVLVIRVWGGEIWLAIL